MPIININIIASFKTDIIPPSSLTAFLSDTNLETATGIPDAAAIKTYIMDRTFDSIQYLHLL